MVESVYWNVGPSQTAPYGAASSPKGRAKGAAAPVRQIPICLPEKAGLHNNQNEKSTDIIPLFSSPVKKNAAAIAAAFFYFLRKDMQSVH